MKNIVDLCEIREHALDDQVSVTFFAAPFESMGLPTHLSTFKIVKRSELAETIKRVRDAGGIFTKSHDGAFEWLIPWPPAAVQIMPLAGPSDVANE